MILSIFVIWDNDSYDEWTWFFRLSIFITISQNLVFLSVISFFEIRIEKSKRRSPLIIIIRRMRQFEIYVSGPKKCNVQAIIKIMQHKNSDWGKPYFFRKKGNIWDIILNCLIFVNYITKLKDICQPVGLSEA